MSAEPRELTAEEGRRLFAERARRHLGISGETFRTLYKSGALNTADHNVLRVAMLLPFDPISEET